MLDTGMPGRGGVRSTITAMRRGHDGPDQMGRGTTTLSWVTEEWEKMRSVSLISYDVTAFGSLGMLSQIITCTVDKEEGRERTVQIDAPQRRTCRRSSPAQHCRRGFPLSTSLHNCIFVIPTVPSHAEHPR